MGDEPSPTNQPFPEWMTWSAITNAEGNEEYTLLSLPLTYYGPSTSLGPDWTYGGETSPAPTEGAAPTAAPTTVLVTVTPDPTTTTVYITLPPVTVTVTAPPFPSVSSFPASSSSASFPLGSPSASFPSSLSSTSLPSPSFSSAPSLTASSPSSSISNIGSGSSSIQYPGISSTSGSVVRPTSSTLTGALPNPPPGTVSNSAVVTRQPYPSTAPSPTTGSGTSPDPESVSALPSVTGTSATYLGLQPDAFLGVILAIVLSVIIFLCCIICWIRHRRRRKRRQQEVLPPPAMEQSSRLLAGDRDPTREDLAYPYTNQEREYRRSQIAMMRARGELDDEWEDRLYSPSMRSASVRLPEDEVGTAYGIRERAFAAAGVYGYAPVSRGPPSTGTGRGSVGGSTQVPTITPANAGVGVAAQSSPTPRKDTRSTEATNDSSAIHMYAAGGRSRTGSNGATDDLFYHQTEEGEGPSPVASSADLHFLQRLGSQGAGGAAAAAAAARAGQRHTPSSGSGSAGSNNNNPPSEIPHTRNLDELPRAAIAYPESPVSDDQESSRLMHESENGVTVMRDSAPQHQSHSSRESGLSRWIHGSDRSTRGSQHTPILQRVLQRVMGNRLSTTPAFSIVPASAPENPTEQFNHPSGNRVPSRDFDFGNGLLFPRPPVHTGYSSEANTARDDMRRWGGLLPSRPSSGNTSSTPRDNVEHAGSVPGSGANVSAMPQMEGDQNKIRALGAPIMAHRDLMPQMRERPPTPGSSSLLGLGLRPPPPSAFPTERGNSFVSSGRSTVYYDARSTTSTPMDTLGSGRASPLARYDSPPPQPVTALRNAQSAQSFHSALSAPFLPPGLFDHSDSEPMDALDMPPPMPIRDVRQARSLNTIFSVGTAETYGTAHSPLSLGQAFPQDEQGRVPPPGFDPAPRTIRSVPSDIAPSEAADADLGAGAFGSIGRASSNWQRDHDMTRVDEDILEDEPPAAVSQWRNLSTHSRDGSTRGSVHEQSRNPATDYLNWRLTLGQSFSITPRDVESLRGSQQGEFAPYYDGPNYDSQGSRDSSNRTNVSHSRDIHSLRASEGNMTGTGGSNGSKGSAQTGSSHNRSVSEYGHFKNPGKSSGGTGEPLLSAFGPGPSRQPRGAGGTTDSADAIASPSPVKRSLWWDSSPEMKRATMPAPAPANSSMIPGIRLVGSRNNAIAGSSGQGPSSAPVLPTRGWPAQGVPLDVTAADGRRSQSHSFIHRDSPASLKSYAPLHSHSPGPSLLHSHLPSGGNDAQELGSGPETSTSHSQDHSHSQHTHGTHGAETTMGTMTEAPTEDDHALPEHEEHDMPLSDVEHILRVQRKEVGEETKMGEEHGRGRIGGGIVPPSPETWVPRWQQL